jgi:TPR repeat protein
MVKTCSFILLSVLLASALNGVCGAQFTTTLNDREVLIQIPDDFADMMMVSPKAAEASRRLLSPRARVLGMWVPKHEAGRTEQSSPDRAIALLDLNNFQGTAVSLATFNEVKAAYEAAARAANKPSANAESPLVSSALGMLRGFFGEDAPSHLRTLDDLRNDASAMGFHLVKPFPIGLLGNGAPVHVAWSVVRIADQSLIILSMATARTETDSAWTRTQSVGWARALLTANRRPEGAEGSIRERADAAYYRDDYRSAMSLYLVMAEGNDAYAQYRIALMYANGQGVRRDPVAASRWYRRAAESGDPKAQNALGNVFDKGLGVKQDMREAARWYRLAAERGYALAQRNLGLLYREWVDVPDNEAEALKWFRAAAASGDAEAMAHVGASFHFGLGVQRDLAEALRWLRQAAESGSATGQNNLGGAYLNGTGVPKDFAEAGKWFRIAAAQGDELAQYNIGYQFETGQGEIQSDRDAVFWYRLSASRGFELAQWKMAVFHFHGRGVVKSFEEAFRWCHMAAVNGHGEAQFQLARMYEVGEGVRPDRGRALQWALIAASSGAKDADKFARQLALGLTAQAVKAAQERARACLARNLEGCS